MQSSRENVLGYISRKLVTVGLCVQGTSEGGSQ